MEVNDLASVEIFLYIFSEKISYYSLEEMLSLEYCRHKLKNVILNLFLKKDYSFDMVSSLGTRSRYIKRCMSMITCKLLVLGCSYSFDSVVGCLYLFPVHILFQQHRGISTVHLEAEGDLHQSNQVQAIIERVHKIQQQLRKFQVLKKTEENTSTL